MSVYLTSSKCKKTFFHASINSLPDPLLMPNRGFTCPLPMIIEAAVEDEIKIV